MISDKLGICCADLKVYSHLSDHLINKRLIKISPARDSLMNEGNYRDLSLLLLEIPEDENELIPALNIIKNKAPQLAIILLDGKLQQTTVAEAFKLGIIDYFPCPVDFFLLQERVEALLKPAVEP